MTNVTRKNKMLPKSAALLSMLKDAMPDSAISNRYKTGRLHFKKIDGEKILKILPGVIDEYEDNKIPGKPFAPPLTKCAHVYDSDEAMEILSNPNTEKMVLCAALVGGDGKNYPNEYYLKIWGIVNHKVAREVFCEIHEYL